MIDYTKQVQVFNAPLQEERDTTWFGKAIFIATLTLLKDLFFFTGRTPRWRYSLLILLAWFTPVASIVTLITTNSNDSMVTFMLSGLLACFFTLTLTIKRINDRSESTIPFLLSIVFIPGLGTFIFIMIGMFAKGTQGANEHGPDPLSTQSN